MTDLEIAKGIVGAAIKAGVLKLVQQLITDGSLAGTISSAALERRNEKWAEEVEMQEYLDPTRTAEDGESLLLDQMARDVWSTVVKKSRQNAKRKRLEKQRQDKNVSNR